jgi:hypothetical protein
MPGIWDSRWNKETVPLESLRQGNEQLYSEGTVFQPRGSETKGPIVVNKNGIVVDGNNRVYEAVKRGDKDIEAYIEASPDEQSAEAGQTTGIAESPEATTPGDISGGQQPAIPPEDARYAGMGQPAPAEASPGSGQPAGTSNRINTEIYGDEGVPSGTGVDTGELLDNARAAIASGDIDPYSVLSKTQAKGIANPEEYAALAAEHERLVNDAVSKQKEGAPDAGEAAQAANDFANAIQPHKTAASDLFRLMQGDVNYDMSTPFGIDQYMKSELGRNMKPSEQPKFTRISNGIRQAETGVADAVTRSDARVRQSYGKVADISMEEAAASVREQLKPCQV